MSIVKSLSVGDGDMFYIKHNSDNFSIIDSCMSDDDRERIVEELLAEASGKGIRRFISTHPDDDHIRGLQYLDRHMKIVNFYCVANQATKPDDTSDFRKYCELRDDSAKRFHLFRGCERKWMNKKSEERGSAGINVLWPVTENHHYKEALRVARRGENANNISPIVKYSQEDGVSILWMGDLERSFMENIKEAVSLPRVHILFAPHHGRDSGKVPQEWLDAMDPAIVVIGEAPSEDLNYYSGFNTLTQNAAGDMTFECEGDKVHIYAGSEDYSVDFLDDEGGSTFANYIGTLNL